MDDTIKPLKSSTNSLLEALKVRFSDKFVLVNEFDSADANFILTHLMKHAFADEENGLCLVILHNTFSHYQNVGKLLEYDLQEKIAVGFASTIEPLKSTFEEDASSDDASLNFLTKSKGEICKNLFVAIKKKVDHLLDQKKTGQIYLVIDDLSHLLDMAVEIKHVLHLINACVNLHERVTVVAGTHVAGPGDEILSNAATYIADVIVDVTPLKTGRSSDVTGVITIKRPEASDENEKETTFHYKALHREIRTFRPGGSIHFLLT